MDEQKSSAKIPIHVPRFVQLSSSSSSLQTSQSAEHEIADRVSIQSKESYYILDAESKEGLATNVVKEPISKDGQKLRYSREFKRASSLKDLKRLSRDSKQFLKARLSDRLLLKMPMWQRSQITLLSQGNVLESDHDNIKSLAVKQVGLQLESGISMLANEHRCANEPFANMEMPHKFFSWELDDCLKRCDLSMVWFNLLLKQLSLNCLETRKISTDFAELSRFIDLILGGYLVKDITMYGVLSLLNLSDEYINLEETLTKELRRNSSTYTNQLYRKIAFTFVHRVSEVQRGTSEDQSADDGTYNPIVFRYLMKYQESVEDQHVIQCETREKKLEDEMREFLILHAAEEHCSESTRNYYYNENETLRQKLHAFTVKYDRSYERVVSQNVYIKLSMKKLVTRKAFLTEQIQRFHKQLKEMEAAELAEQEAEIAKKVAEAEAEAQLLHEKKLAKKRKRLEKQRAKQNIFRENIKKSQNNVQNET